MKKAKILIIEYENIAVREIKAILENNGYPVSSTVASCEEAIEKTREKKPDIVLTDIKLIEKEIRERKRSEQALKTSEKSYREIFNAVNESIFIYDLEILSTIDVNQTTCETFGYSYEEALKLSLEDISQGEGLFSPRQAKQWIKKAINEGPQLVEWVCKRKNGDLFWSEVNLKRAVIDGHDCLMAVVRDISKRKEHESELREQRNLFKTMLSSMPEFVALKDRNSAFVAVNPAFCQFMGKQENEIIGKTVFDLFPKQEAEFVRKKDLEVVTTKKSLVLDQIITGTEGRRWLSTTKTPVFNTSGECNSLLITVRDISDRKKTEEHLIKARDEAEAANQAKSAFLANMSHEIRTPMNAILGFTELLDSLITDRKQKKYLESVKSSGKNLLTLINDILDLSKIEAGKLDIQYEPVNSYVIFEEIRNIFSLKIHEKNLDFITDISPDIPETLLLDEIRLRQVLFNLIGNAIKFTEKGHIKLSVGKALAEENQGKLDMIIKVEDTGIGIPAESQEKIFESFTQKDDQDTKKYGGSGLGLAITKRLVNIMNGTISVKSTVNKGSVFEITLRSLSVGAASPFLPDSLPRYEKTEFETAIILTVDDIETNRNLVKEYFQNTNLDFIEAENGEEAVLSAGQYKPDLILMDIRMPVMDGYEATRLIKNNEELRHIPVIALTASAMDTEKEKILNSGFDGYLRKPVQRSDLFDELSRFIPYSKQKPGFRYPGKRKEGAEDISLEGEPFEKVQEIIERLDSELTGSWESVRRKGSFDDISEFGVCIKEFGGQYKLDILEKYGKDITDYAGDFDVEGIETALNSFPGLIRKIKSKMKGPAL